MPHDDLTAIPGNLDGSNFKGVRNQLLPVDTKGYGWLDASVNYKLTDNLMLTVEAAGVRFGF